MNKQAETTDNKTSKFQWFLVTLFIPFIFTLIVAVIVLAITDINILDKAKEGTKKVPFISGFFEEKPNKTTKQNEVSHEGEIVELEAKMADLQTELEAMEGILDAKDETIQRNNLEKEQLEAEINELRLAQSKNKTPNQDIIKTYEHISAKKSAPIITNMNDEDAVKILASLKSDTLADIVEQMTPEDAARLMKKLSILVEQNER